jgi:energy-coupling factor transport system substrate-specific component
MKCKTGKAERLNAKDLITIGIFTAIYIAAYMIIGLAVRLMFFAAPITTAITSIFTGVIYMLMAVKVRKRGVFFITGIAMTLLTLTSGNVYGVIGGVIASFVSECIADRKHYRKVLDLMLAYTATITISFVGYCFPAYYSTKTYIEQLSARQHMSQEAIHAYTKYINWPAFGILTIVTILCSFFGAWIGIKLLDKHFRKAGLI